MQKSKRTLYRSVYRGRCCKGLTKRVRVLKAHNGQSVCVCVPGNRMSFCVTAVKVMLKKLDDGTGRCLYNAAPLRRCHCLDIAI